MHAWTATPDQPSYVIVLGGAAAPTVSGNATPAVRLPSWLRTGTHGGSPAPVVIAADSGLDVACAAGLPVSHVVGDLDSVGDRVLEAAEAAGVVVHRHHRDKDATDSELAIELVVALAEEELSTASARPHLVVLGPGGGRLDHLLVDVSLLAASSLERFEVTAALGPADIVVVRPGRPRSVPGQPGDLLSLIALHGPARGVTTTGLRWPLVDADLAAGTTRGLSNEVTGPVTVSITEGVLVAVAPGMVAGRLPSRPGLYDPSPRWHEPAPDRPDPAHHEGAKK